MTDDADPATHEGGGDQRRPTLLEQMGGPMGMLDSGLPVVVFVIVNLLAGLTAGIIAALAAGVLIAVLRLVRHRPVTQAIGGLIAVGIAAFIAHRMGSARGYFLFGIWSYVLYGGVLLVSVLVRWPLIGVLWEGLNGRGATWRADRRLVRRYDAATLVWVAVFAARFAVQQWLYGNDQVGWLAVARLAMGYPLFLIAILATVLIVGAARGMQLPAMLRRHRERQDDAAGQREDDAVGERPSDGTAHSAGDGTERSAADGTAHRPADGTSHSAAADRPERPGEDHGA